MRMIIGFVSMVSDHFRTINFVLSGVDCGCEDFCVCCVR